MFETAILRKHGQAFTSIDHGLIAETLLFYSNVHVVAHFGVLIDLLKVFGADTLLRLIDDKLLTLTYLRTDFGTVTVNHGGVEYHSFAAMRHGGPSKTAGPGDPGKKNLTNEESVQLAFERALGKSWPTHRSAKKFLRKISVRQNIDILGQKDGLPGLARTDLDDASYVHDAIRESIKELVPTYAPAADFRFAIWRTDSGFIIDHNIDLIAVNAKFKALHPSSDTTLTPALLVGQLLEGRVDLKLASDYMAEIVTNGATASTVRRKFAALMTKRDKNLSDIGMFQNAHLQNARAIREAINSGAYSFDDFLKVLHQAEKFKTWLRTSNPDADLLSEYYKAVSADSWIGRLPSKITRFFLATGIGIALEALHPSGLSTAAGAAVGAVDSFLLDPLFKGWRPNQFVEGPLQKLSS